MTGLLILTTLGLVTLDVQAKPLSGPAADGRLAELSPERIVVETADGPRTFRGAELLHLSINESAPTAGYKPSVWIDLVDGSQVAASDVLVEGEKATVELPSPRVIELTTRQFSSIRFHPPSDDLAQQWAEAIGKDVRGDRLVVRKSPQSINYLEGLLGDIAKEAVKFRYEAEEVTAPRERLEGLVYFHALQSRFASPVCKVVDADGSTWHARTFEMADDSLVVTLLSGPKLTIPLARIRKLDFASGNLSFLSDLEPETAEWTPWFASTVLADRLNQLYTPKRDRSFSDGPMMLRRGGIQTSYEKGLALHSRTRMVYRLTGEQRKLVAQVGIDARVGNAGNVELVIKGDGRELLRREVTGEQDAFGLDLEIPGVKRLEILVDYGKNLDLADHLNLCDAMLTQ